MYDPETEQRPFYIISLMRFEPAYQELFEECQITYRVVRQESPLALVRKCS